MIKKLLKNLKIDCREYIMAIFSKSKPIWIDKQFQIDEHAQFLVEYFYDSGKVDFFICADSDYILYVNGKVAAFGQYHSYPNVLYYDKIKIDRYLKKGNNVIAVEVWHYGADSFVHADAKTGLIFEMTNNGETVVVSDSNVLSRKSPVYVSGEKKEITKQLGFSYCYDAREDDEWLKGVKVGFHKSAEINAQKKYLPRPIKKLQQHKKVYGTLIKKENYSLYDLGKEYAGYPFINIKAKAGTKIIVGYGEHIVDGRVRRVLDNGRDFSFTYIAKNGNNNFIGLFRRLGCRYLEIISENEVQVKSVGIIPVSYPLKRISKDFGNDLRNKIYKIALNTLDCCMHEHYEDCPWREQALYTMDSRNQMLCSYYAFVRPEKYIRSNIDLILSGQRKNGQLDLCFPSNDKIYIPSFSLHFFTQVKEYLLYTGDKKAVKRYLPALVKLLDSFLENTEDGLICTRKDEGAWNFYEWKEGYAYCDDKTDLIINCLFSIALKHYDFITENLGVKNAYKGLAEKMNEKIYVKFFDSERKIFRMWADRQQYSVLANALAVLAEVPNSATEEVANLLLDRYDDVMPTTLSMKCFQYDALLKIDRERYKEHILNRIDSDYKYMIENGATSFWETMEGEKDFAGHASLCHGWSAMPIYYYNELLENK